MPQMKFGTPQGFKEKVLAVLADSSTVIKDKLSVLGFNFNPMGNFWARAGEFQPHVVKTLETLGVEPSAAVLEKCKIETLPRVFPSGNFKSEMLLGYQRDALDFCKKSGSGIVALAIGLGKTVTAIGYADHLGQKTLVVCPASLRGQWYTELAKFNKDEPKRIVIDGSREKRKKQWEIAKQCQYVICSYDLMRSKEDLAAAKDYLQGGFLIFDEIMRIKNRESQRTKACMSLRDTASRCIGLTGTPIDNNLGEFYTILNITSPRFLPSYERFAEMFLVRELRQGPNGRSFWQILGSKNVDEFRSIIKSLVIRREKRECLDLPPASTVIRQVEFSKEQKRIEKRLLELAKDDPDNILKYFTYARENFISPSLLPVEILDRPMGLSLWDKAAGETEGESSMEYITSEVERLISGAITSDDVILTPRLQEISDIIEDCGKEKIIIFCTYVKALELIKRTILRDQKVTMVIGGANVPEEISKFRDPSYRFLLLSEAGIEGLNLQFSHIMIIVNTSWTESRMSQLRGRIERSGQKNPMVFYELRSPSIVEQRVLKILEKKEKLSEKVLARRVMDVRL